MKPIALVLLLVPLTLFAAGNEGAKEDVKKPEKAKEREYNKDTGLPIYDEDEAKPVGILYHLRSKTPSESAPEKKAVKEPEKIEVKDLPRKEREYNKDTGYPVYDEDEKPPVGIIYHVRNKTYTSATSGFT